MPEREREEVISPTDPERWLGDRLIGTLLLSRNIISDNFYNLQCYLLVFLDQNC